MLPVNPPYAKFASNSTFFRSSAKATRASLRSNATTGCKVTPLASDLLIEAAELEPLAAGLDGLPIHKPRADSPLIDAFDDASD